VVNETPDLTAVPARLSPLVEQCLAKDPAARPTPAEILAELSDDIGVLTGEWLPPTIAESMSRYRPTVQTPLPPALKEQEPSPAGPGAVAAGAAVAGAAVAGVAAGGAAAAAGSAAAASDAPAPAEAAAAGPPAADRATPPLGPATPALGSSAADRATPPPETALSGLPGPIGYEPTTLEPAVQGPGAADPLAATRAERSLGPELPETSLVPVSGPFTAGRDVPGGTGGVPPAGPPSVWRRWRWPIAAAAAAVIIAVVAVLLVSSSHGAPKVNPTPSLAGETTKPPVTPKSSQTPTEQPTATPTSQSSGFATTTQPTATATSTATATPTSSPTPTATATPTTSATPTTTATTPSATPTATTPTTAAPTTNPSTAPATAGTP